MKKISFCFTHKDRLAWNVGKETLPLFMNCLSTLKNQLTVLNIVNYEIVITSFDNENTYQALNIFLSELFPREKIIIIKKQEDDFTRGGGRQIAFDNSTGDIIAFIDCDMLFVRYIVIQKGIVHVDNNESYFPICSSMERDGTVTWRPTGTGNCFVPRNIASELKWMSKKSWGVEDGDYMKLVGNLIKVNRDNCPGWYHQFHPNSASHPFPNLRTL